MNVLVTGASGFIGGHLVKALLNEKHKVHVLTRNIPLAAMKLGTECSYHQLDFGGAWTQKFVDEGIEVDAIINLAGANISEGRWTDQRKRELFNSRIDTTREVVRLCSRLAIKPKVVVSGSAIGYYGFSSEGQEFNEESAEGNDFLAYMCQKWEEPIVEAFEKNILSDREVRLRIGVVLGPNGGAYKQMLPPFKCWVGGDLGSGKQDMSFIHVKDLVNLMMTCLDNAKYSGPVNAVTPYSCTNAELTKVLGKALGVPTIFKVPPLALQLRFGEMSSILLKSSKIKPSVLVNNDFHFQFPTIDSAIKDLVSST